MPQGGGAEHLERVAAVDAAAVRLATTGEHGVGSHVDRAVDHPGHVHAEERPPRVGHRVDQVTHQMAGRRCELVVLAAERQDRHRRRGARHAGDPVAVQPGAVHEPLGDDVTAARRDAELAVGAAGPLDPGHLGTRHERTPAGGQVVGERPGDTAVVGDRRVGHVQCGDARDVRLDGVQLGRADASDPEPVVPATLLEGAERGELRGRRRDDHLAAAVEGQVVGRAVRLQQAASAGDERGLRGTWCVVDARVHDPGVATGLVAGGAVLLVEHDHTETGPSTLQLDRRREPHDAGADHHHVGRSVRRRPGVHRGSRR